MWRGEKSITVRSGDIGFFFKESCYGGQISASLFSKRCAGTELIPSAKYRSLCSFSEPFLTPELEQ